MSKIPVCFGEGIAPHCPNCRSGEYLYNEDENANNYCGQCGCELDWENMYNEDTGRIERRYKCRDCVNYGSVTLSRSICKARGISVAGCELPCKKHFEPRITEFGV